MQHDLFANDQFTLHPAEGRTEPRLWIRRLILWEEPGKAIRDIELRPGLNIIWSPDTGSPQGQIGHGGGKTTLCRLLRYCLDEESYGPESQREAIANHLPLAMVGAEVRLDGEETWLIRRTLGAHREDFAVRGPSFADVVGWPDEPTGMQPFRNAAMQAFLQGAENLMPRSLTNDDRWRAMLAWLTRDQECRLAHLLDWRSPDSGSHSPVSGRNRSQEDRLTIMRVVLDALEPEELQTSRDRDSAQVRLANQRDEATSLEHQSTGLRRRLAAWIGVDRDEVLRLEVAALRSTAEANLERAQAALEAEANARLQPARMELESAVANSERIEQGIKAAASESETQDSIVKLAGDELPELSAQNQRLQHPVCPVCGVLIDEARAKGCGISLQECDLQALEKRVENLREARNAARSRVQELKQEQSTLQKQRGEAEVRLLRARTQLDAVEREMRGRSQALRQAERATETVDDLETMLRDLEAVGDAIEGSDADVKTLAEQLAAHRDSVAGVVSRLSERFDKVFRRFVPTAALSRVLLDGNGLTVRVPADGAAMDSLRVAAFDLAALTLAIEGETRHPGFLVHDSPREADLGGSIYANLFDLVRFLESVSATPLFQYVVTTTTEPPENCRSEPWLRLTLHGSPADERLLKADL